jgi:protein TonB
MAEQHVHRYDPLWDSGRKMNPKSRGARIAIGLSIAAHIGLGYYIYETKFVPHYMHYEDPQALSATIVDLPKPAPPEAAKPPPPVERAPLPPQPPLAPRIPVITDMVGTVPPLPIPPLPAPTPPAPEPPAPEAPRAPVQKVITNPDWSARPSGEDMARYYPEQAQRLEAAGNVVLNCIVTAKGTVAGCTVLSEDPMGYGFGEAALKLSRLFKMKPRMVDGQAVEGAMVKIPIAFRIAS